MVFLERIRTPAFDLELEVEGVSVSVGHDVGMLDEGTDVVEESLGSLTFVECDVLPLGDEFLGLHGSGFRGWGWPGDFNMDGQDGHEMRVTGGAVSGGSTDGHRGLDSRAGGNDWVFGREVSSSLCY